jgi:hypothetical protein
VPRLCTPPGAASQSRASKNDPGRPRPAPSQRATVASRENDDGRPRSRAVAFETGLTVTFPPPRYDSVGFLLQLASPLPHGADAPAPPPWPSLFAGLVARRSAARALGAAGPRELPLPAVRAPQAPQALQPTEQQQQQREGGQHARDAERLARLQRQSAAEREVAALSRALDKDDAARGCARRAVARNPGPVPRTLVAKMMEYQHERNVLPRHQSVRPESFR